MLNERTQKRLLTRVNRGIELLDEKKPGWPAKINWQKLDLSSFENGLIEQLLKAEVGGSSWSFSAACNWLGITTAQASDFGFDLTEAESYRGDTFERWKELSRIWSLAIRERAPVYEYTQKAVRDLVIGDEFVHIFTWKHVEEISPAGTQSSGTMLKVVPCYHTRAPGYTDLLILRPNSVHTVRTLKKEGHEHR